MEVLGYFILGQLLLCIFSGAVLLAATFSVRCSRAVNALCLGLSIVIAGVSLLMLPVMHGIAGNYGLIDLLINWSPFITLVFCIPSIYFSFRALNEKKKA